MLKEAKMTTGTGAKTAHSIPELFTSGLVRNRLQIYANSAKQEKLTGNARQWSSAQHRKAGWLGIFRFFASTLLEA